MALAVLFLLHAAALAAVVVTVRFATAPIREALA